MFRGIDIGQSCKGPSRLPSLHLTRIFFTDERDGRFVWGTRMSRQRLECGAFPRFRRPANSQSGGMPRTPNAGASFKTPLPKQIPRFTIWLGENACKVQ